MGKLEELGMELLEMIETFRKRFNHVCSMNKGEFFALHTIMIQSCRKHKVEQESFVGLTVSEFSKAMELSKPAASQLLRNLEEKGMVERSTTKEDRRVVFIHLTEQGQRHLTEGFHAWKSMLDTIGRKMGEEDTRQLIRLFRRMDQVLAEMVKEGSFNAMLKHGGKDDICT